MRVVLRRLLWSVFALLGVYLIAGNLFLNTPIGPWAINHKPDKFQLHWSQGITWWPGYAKLWNVEAQGHVRHVQWSAKTPRGSARIALLPLLSRELRMPWIEAGVVQGTVQRVALDMLPPPARPKGWTIRLDRIHTAQIEHARVLGFDIDMQGGASFGMVKQMRGGPWQILPSTFDLKAMRASRDGREFLRNGSVSGRFEIDSHRREEASGLATLGLTDAALRVQGELAGMSLNVDSSGHWTPGFARDDLQGRLDLDLHWQRGWFANGGKFEIEVPMQVTSAAEQVIAEASLHTRFEADGMHLDLDVPATPKHPGSIHANLFYAQTDATLPADAKAALARLSGTLALNWRFASLDWLGQALVKAPWLSLAGSGQVDADVRIEAGQLQPGSRVDVPQIDLVATVAEHVFRGSARARGVLEDSANGKLARVDLDLARFDAAALAEPDKVLASGRDLAIRFESDEDLGKLRESMKASLRFKGAAVPDLKAINSYLPTDAVRISGGSATLDGDLSLDGNGQISTGRVLVNARKAGARLGQISLRSDFDLDARIGGSKLATRHFDLDNSTLKLRNVSVIDKGRTQGESWWANLTLKRAQVEARKPLRINAKVNVEMQNVGLLLALFTRHSDYPRWVLKLADAGSLRATGDMRMLEKTLVFDSVEARNDRFEVNARMRMAKAATQGDLLIRWKLLKLGLEVGKGAHQFHLRRAAEWYSSQPRLIPSQ
ncbi:MAG TPA: hypothetical protein VFN25_04420 [Dokdonella sp.]|uniref:hypothetical protein n=1 Tax=Dokdonella sp. TaxID=2291710 RepID=UPI002D7EB10D|nr:hypothetical protein [Dokdonella sp.]HET9032133.1 hypothetical protein [Dokdonella sp.]